MPDGARGPSGGGSVAPSPRRRGFPPQWPFSGISVTPMPRAHQLHQRRQRRAVEPRPPRAAAQAADLQRLIAKAMPLPPAAATACRAARWAWARGARRRPRGAPVRSLRRTAPPPSSDGSEIGSATSAPCRAALDQLADQPVGLGFAHLQVGAGVARREVADQARQKVGGAMVGINAQPQPPARPVAAGARDLLQPPPRHAGCRGRGAAISSPRPVSRTCRAPRSNSRPPRPSSNSLICMDKAGWVTEQASAAWPKWPWRASAATYRSCLRVRFWS